MTRNLLAIAGMLGLTLVLAGLVFPSRTGPPADFTFVNGAEPETLDPQLMTGQPEGRLAIALFEGLTRRHPKTLEPLPGAAERWEVSPDGKSYTFHLRPGLRWSDGRPLTAGDFAWSWRRLETPELGADYAYLIHMVRGARAFNTWKASAEKIRGEIIPALKQLHLQGETLSVSAWRAWRGKQKMGEALLGTRDARLQQALFRESLPLTPEEMAQLLPALAAEADRREAGHEHAKAHFGVDEGVFAVDDRTLIVELESPTSYFLDLTSFYTTLPVPRHVVESNPERWFFPDTIVSNGPYRLASWRVNEKIRLIQSETYWDRDGVKLEVVDALPFERAALYVNLFNTGRVQWAPSPATPALQAALKGSPVLRYGDGLGTYFYRFNCTRKPFDDPRVRRAFCLAVDRDSICRGVLALDQDPAVAFVPPLIPGYEPPPPSLSFDPALARRLLAEAGYPRGRGFPKVGVLYNNNEGHRIVAEAVAQQLKVNLGVDVGAYNQEWKAYLQTTKDMKYDIARAGWIGDYRDPMTFLDMWVTNGGNNQTGWSNPLYDRWIAFAGDMESFLDAPDRQAWLARMAEPKRCEERLAQVESAPTAERRTAALLELRMHILREAEAVLMSQGPPVLPIYTYVYSSLVDPRVKNWYVNDMDVHPIRDLLLESR